MAGREEEEVVDTVKHRLESWSNRFGAGGTVQKRSGPDVWAFLVALALTMESVALGIAVVDPLASAGAATILAVAGLLVAGIAALLRRRST